MSKAKKYDKQMLKEARRRQRDIDIKEAGAPARERSKVPDERFRASLLDLIDDQNIEEKTGLPDYILADFLNRSLRAFIKSAGKLRRQMEADVEYEENPQVAEPDVVTNVATGSTLTKEMLETALRDFKTPPQPDILMVKEFTVDSKAYLIKADGATLREILVNHCGIMNPNIYLMRVKPGGIPVYIRDESQVVFFSDRIEENVFFTRIDQTIGAYPQQNEDIDRFNRLQVSVASGDSPAFKAWEQSKDRSEVFWELDGCRFTTLIPQGRQHTVQGITMLELTYPQVERELLLKHYYIYRKSDKKKFGTHEWIPMSMIHALWNDFSAIREDDAPEEAPILYNLHNYRQERKDNANQDIARGSGSTEETAQPGDREDDGESEPDPYANTRVV